MSYYRRKRKKLNILVDKGWWLGRVVINSLYKEKGKCDTDVYKKPLRTHNETN